MRLYGRVVLIATCLSLTMGAGKFIGKTEGNLPMREELKNERGLRLIPMSPTPEPDTAMATIQYPQKGELVRENPIWVQIRVDGYSLGSDSEFDRSSEIFDSDLGQTIHVIVDNEPYFPINGPSIDPFHQEGYYYHQIYKVKIPNHLEDGYHTLRIFPARSYNESLKGERTFDVSYFYVGKKNDESQRESLSKPYLTYNEPSPLAELSEDKPILVDFFLTNCDLSPDGYKVRLTVDGSKRLITAWQPYYLYGLKKGKHVLELDLVDSKNRAVPGPYNTNKRTIIVH